jgi:4-hydroxy-tetrahydrodipicolinate synthase
MLCVEVAKGRVPVIAGTGSNSTKEAIKLTRHASQAGADAVLVVTPYYNKPTQEGLYQHYKAIHDAVDIPIVIYNIPGRCAVDMSVETMARLAALPNIVGVKDATCDLARPAKTRLAISPEFAQMSGEDATVVPFLAQGGHGCISVTANLAPRLCAELHEAWQGGDLESVRTINDRLMPLHEALFLETSPAPVKYAASLLGKCRNSVRQPLVKVSEQTEAKVRAAMAHAGLIN